jgi:hypothetical protein
MYLFLLHQSVNNILFVSTIYLTALHLRIINILNDHF